jgi:hypothetical protein
LNFLHSSAFHSFNFSVEHSCGVCVRFIQSLKLPVRL